MGYLNFKSNYDLVISLERYFPFLFEKRVELVDFFNRQNLNNSQITALLAEFCKSFDFQGPIYTTNLFVYGTLLPGNPQFDMFKVCEYSLHPAYVNGQLYSINDKFPGLVDGDNQIKGTMIKIKASFTNLLRLFSRLNSYEGFTGDKPLYSLQKTLATRVDGIQDYVYFYKFERLDSNHKLIEGGDWLDYISTSGGGQNE